MPKVRLGWFIFILPFLSVRMSQGENQSAIIPGIEVLVREEAGSISGKRIGLITNHTGVDRQLRHDIDLLWNLPGVRLVALFSPEHGIRGMAQAGEEVSSSLDPRSGIPIFSLYGRQTRPTPEMLRDVDLLVYDIQDLGLRFYTYIFTLGECMKAASAAGIPFLVLDRPAPLTGAILEGNLLEEKMTSAVGPYRIPIRYGMTPGELAIFLKGELNLPLKLDVVKMKNWRRSNWQDETGLAWIPPSPNIPTLQSALVYAGTCLIEGTNLSEGRGTAQPFEILGAPWIDGEALAESLNKQSLPGVLFRPTGFTPAFSKFSGQNCRGIQIHIVDRNRFQSLETALALISHLRHRYLDKFQWLASHFDRLAGTEKLRASIDAGKPVSQILAEWKKQLGPFLEKRQKCLLYR
jgi:uncharacterized protein YbbC (DUF1343 family)